MGAPELPENTGQEDLRPTELIQPAPIASDESDNESVDMYDGYQPLALDENPEEAPPPDVTTDAYNDVENEVEEFPNLTPIESAEVEITRQVWNAPRPQENEIELDTTKTEQILNAMASFTLPNATIPEWAVNVPEEHWKEELLQRIRHRKESQGNTSSKVVKESNEPQE